jgi:hypothetical protein
MTPFRASATLTERWEHVGFELDMDLGSAIELEAMTQALLMTSHDHGELYRAWSEGRTPAWAGR